MNAAARGPGDRIDDKGTAQRAYIGLGANLHEPVAQLNAAIAALARLPGVWRLRSSAFYRSAPLGYTAQPDFVNAVCEIDTDLPARALLEALLGIEQRHGRQRSFANAPRTLDLDILLYADQVIDEPGLVVPHPRMLQRAFVLLPLLELDRDIVVPGAGKAARYLSGVADQGISKMRHD